MPQKFLWSHLSFFYKLIFIISFLPVTIWLKEKKALSQSLQVRCQGNLLGCLTATGWMRLEWALEVSSCPASCWSRVPWNQLPRISIFPIQTGLGCLQWWRFYNLCFSLCPLPLALPLGSTGKSLALPSLQPPFRYLPWWHSLWASSSLGKTVPTLQTHTGFTPS